MHSTTTIVLTDASQFPSSGTNFIQIGTEEISYTGISTNTLTGVTRGVRNTTAATHSNGATVLILQIILHGVKLHQVT